MNLTELSKKIDSAPSLDFGTIFSNSIELFKKTWGQGILMLLLNILLVLPAIIILYIPIIAAAVSANPESDVQVNNVSAVSMVAFALLFIPVMIFVQALTIGLNAGFYRVIKDKDSGVLGQDSNLFQFLKKDQIGKLFMLSMMSFGITILAMLLCYLPVFYVAVPVSLIPVILAFNSELTPSEIVKASFKLGNKKWLLIFGLAVVSYLLSQIVGLLLCGIGIFFTASFIYLPNYFVYKEAVGFKDATENPQIATTEF